MNRSKKPQPRQPFFARFLERQHLVDIAGAKPPIDTTLKFPSDSDEDSR